MLAERAVQMFKMLAALVYQCGRGWGSAPASGSLTFRWYRQKKRKKVFGCWGHRGASEVLWSAVVVSDSVRVPCKCSLSLLCFVERLQLRR